jgi:hypothetical protein
VVLESPWYFLQRARKLAQNLLKTCSKLACSTLSDLETRCRLLPPYLRASPSAAISSRLHHSPLARLASSTDRSRPLSSPPPPLVATSLALVLVVSVVGRRGQRHRRIRRRRAGGGGRSHPSSTSSVATMTLRVARPPPLIAPSNICSRSRQCDNIAAPAIVSAARRTSILAKNAATALLLARGTSFPTAAVADAVPPPPPRLATRLSQQHVDCHFPFEA